jgi:hypothetical protein
VKLGTDGPDEQEGAHSARGSIAEEGQVVVGHQRMQPDDVLLGLGTGLLQRGHGDRLAVERLGESTQERLPHLGRGTRLGLVDLFLEALRRDGEPLPDREVSSSKSAAFCADVELGIWTSCAAVRNAQNNGENAKERRDEARN